MRHRRQAACKPGTLQDSPGASSRKVAPPDAALVTPVALVTLVAALLAAPAAVAACVSTSAGRIGYAGLVAASQRRQGSGKTSVGTFTVTESFGIKPNPGTRLPFLKVRTGDYWVQDDASRCNY